MLEFLIRNQTNKNTTVKLLFYFLLNFSYFLLTEVRRVEYNKLLSLRLSNLTFLTAQFRCDVKM